MPRILASSEAKVVAGLALVLVCFTVAGALLQWREFRATGTLGYGIDQETTEPAEPAGYPSWLFEEIRQRFDPDQERSVPTWFSSMLLMLCSATLFGIAGSRSKRRRGLALQWYLLALVCALLSVDEIAGFHEMVGGRQGSPGTALLWKFGLVGNVYFYFDWILAAGVLVIILTLLYLPLFVRLPGRTMLLLGAGALIYVAGALGLEAISSAEAYTEGSAGVRYNIIVGAEEFLESAGVLLAIAGLLFYLRDLRAATDFAPAAPVAHTVIAPRGPRLQTTQHGRTRLPGLRGRLRRRSWHPNQTPAARGPGQDPRE